MRRSIAVSAIAALLASAAISACSGSAGGKPAVAIDGTIVFATPIKGQTADIYLLDAQGTRRLTGGGAVNRAYPVWSPDGTRIAYVTATDQLAVINRDGTGGAYLTPETNSNMVTGRPAWLPDGNISLYVGGKLAVLGPDGSGVAVLTPSNPKLRTGGFGGSAGYAWSPDGTQLVFDCGSPTSFPEVCLFDAASGESRTLLEPERAFYSFAWSPDGRKIVAGDYSGGSQGVVDAADDLYVFDADGRGLHAIAQPGSEANPAWSPNGSMIVYDCSTDDPESDTGSSLDLWVMNADGSGAQRLSSGITAVQPDWTTD